MNRVIIIGNLGKTPELKQGSSGIEICNLSVATKESGGKDKPQVTEWHKIIAFGKTASNCAQYLTVGSQVAVEGRLQTRKWEDKQGVTHYSTEIVASHVEFLGSGNGKKEEKYPPAPSNDLDSACQYGEIPF